jgi:Xaa-Pro aminopeptidase
MNPALDPFRKRRAQLAALMHAQGGGMAVLSAAPEKTRNRDTHYPYRQDSYFHYLTGFDEPNAVLVILAKPPAQAILFCRPKDPEIERWEGIRLGPDEARDQLGFDHAWPIAQLTEKWPELMADQPCLWTPMGRDPDWDCQWAKALSALRAKGRTGTQAPERFVDLHAVLDEMRLIKDDTEKALLQKAADIAALAHKQAMQLAAPGIMEYQLAAEIERCFQWHGAQHPAYPSIVAGGANACILHYTENKRPLGAGELVLIDAGCEWQGYASDITRTFPVNARFEGPAKALYEVVLNAQAAALSCIHPGAPFDAFHEAAVKVIAEGLLALGLLKGSLTEILEKETYKRFYMHRTGHWLGRDVHDAGAYRKGGLWRPLEPGMVVTVEPGCYVSPAADVPEAFWNIGIRIEDDVFVTTEGHEILTAGVPKAMADIEHWMREGKPNGNA